MRCITESREAHTSSKGHPRQHHTTKLWPFHTYKLDLRKLQHTAEREQKRSELPADVKNSEVAGELLNENAWAILASRLRYHYTEERKQVWTGIQLRHSQYCRGLIIFCMNFYYSLWVMERINMRFHFTLMIFRMRLWRERQKVKISL